MKLKILIGILVFLIAVNLATLGSYVYFRMQEDEKSAQMPHTYGFPGRFPPPPHLGLDREQRGQLLELRRNFEKDTREYSQRIRDLHNDIFMAVKDDSVSMSEIEVKLAEISRLRMEIEKVAIRKLLEARHYLSPAQRDHLYRFLLRESPHFDKRKLFQGKQSFPTRGKSELNKYDNQK